MSRTDDPYIISGFYVFDDHRYKPLVNVHLRGPMNLPQGPHLHQVVEVVVDDGSKSGVVVRLSLEQATQLHRDLGGVVWGWPPMYDDDKPFVGPVWAHVAASVARRVERLGYRLLAAERLPNTEMYGMYFLDVDGRAAVHRLPWRALAQLGPHPLVEDIAKLAGEVLAWLTAPDTEWAAPPETST